MSTADFRVVIEGELTVIKANPSRPCKRFQCAVRPGVELEGKLLLDNELCEIE